MNNLPISIDTASEALAYMIAKKQNRRNQTEDLAEKIRLTNEIEILLQEKEIIYGKGTAEEQKNVMEKITNIYSQQIKNEHHRATSSPVVC
jgi:hypothetical protein